MHLCCAVRFSCLQVPCSLKKGNFNVTRNFTFFFSNTDIPNVNSVPQGRNRKSRNAESTI